MNIGVMNTRESFSKIHSELELYFSLRTTRQVTFANRIGGDHNFGEFPFYEANTIGGTTNLRGFNARRFSGRSALFNNTEVRLGLFDFYRYLLGGEVGINSFFDTGRVWTDGESSSIWHIGYGGGIWFNAFDSFLINTAVGFSEEGSIFTIKTGFLF
jgi:hemolysin activation/secretion protein